MGPKGSSYDCLSVQLLREIQWSENGLSAIFWCQFNASLPKSEVESTRFLQAASIYQVRNVVRVLFKYSQEVNIYSVPRIMPGPGNKKKQLENSDVDSFTQGVKC